MKIEILNEKSTLDIIPFNRSVAPNLGLRESLRKYGFIDTVKVIETCLFGKKKGLYIIDGQHRYNEGKILQMKVPYIVIAKCDTLQDIVKLMATFNNTQRKWVIENYVDCYAACGMSDYIYIRQKRGETSFNYAVLASIFTGSACGGGTTKSLRKGIFTISDKSKGDMLLLYILDLLKVSKLSDRAIHGFIIFYNSIMNYNHKLFLNNFKISLPLLTNCMEITQFNNKFNEIYNK